MCPLIANKDACCDLYGGDGGQTVIGAPLPPAKVHVFLNIPIWGTWSWFSGKIEQHVATEAKDARVKSLAFVLTSVGMNPPPTVVDPVQEMHGVFNMALSFPPSVHCYEF